MGIKVAPKEFNNSKQLFKREHKRSYGNFVFY